MQDTNQAYLINSVESEGCRTCYEYRAGAIRGTRDAGEGQKRDVATQFYYVTREYDQDVKTGKKANGIKYDYFQKQKGEKSLTTYFDFFNGTQARQYGEDGLSNVTLESSYNPKKHKDNGLVSDYTYKVSDIDFESLHLEKQPKKNVSLSVYNTNRLLTDEVEEGKEKSETLYDYDDDGKGSLVVLETEKEYGKNRSSKPVTTKEGYGYDSYRNLTSRKEPKAYLNRNKGKEYLFTAEYKYYGTESGYPAEDVSYSLSTIICDEEYLNNNTKVKLVSTIAKNGIDYASSETQIKEGSREYRTVSKTDFTYDIYGNETRGRIYPYYAKEGISEVIQNDHIYNEIGQQTKKNITIISAKNSIQNQSYVEERTMDSFGNEVTFTGRNGLITANEYNENTGKVIKNTEAIGTSYEFFNEKIISEDSLKSMTIDCYNRCIVEIWDAFGNTVVEKDEKAGTWTESTYDYGEEASEEDDDGDNDADTEGLLVEEKVYAFEPVGDKIIKDENGEGVPNFDIGGRGNEILSGSRYIYDDYGEEIVSATFSGGAMDSGHCSSWTLSKETEEVEDGQIVSTSYTKQLNPKHYQEQVDKNHYYNQLDTYVLSETIEESIQDEEGNIISATSTYKRGNGISQSITKYIYDEFGKVTRKETSTKKYQDGKWLPAKETQELYEYDYQGNVTKTETRQKAEGEDKWEVQITCAVYDEQGQLIEVYSPKGVKEGYCTTYEYDLLGRMVKERTPLDKKDGVIRYQTKSMEYDINDNLIAEEEEQTDSQTMRTEYSYDQRGNLLQVKNCLENGQAQYTQYVYDTEGNKIRQYTGLTGALTLSVKEGVGDNLYAYADRQYNVSVSGKKKKDVCSETKYEYNKRNELTAIVDPEGRRETYTYDIYGNLVKSIDKNGNVIRNDYDFQNRIVKKEAKEKETGEVTAHIYSYNAYGELLKQDNTTFEYGDVSGLVTKEVTRGEDGADISKSYTYNSDDNRTSFAVAVGDKTELSLSYTYDAFSRLSAVNSTDGDHKERIAEYSYDENGNLEGRTTGENGLDISYRYDLSDRVIDLENKVNGESDSELTKERKISSFHSAYLKNGQKSSEQSVVYSEEEKKDISKTSEYTYDRLGRLIQEKRTGSDDISYSYDAHNNRKKMKSGNQVTAYRYNKNDELFRTDTLNKEDELDSVTLYKNDKNGNELAKVSRQETENKGETYFNLDISIGDNRLNENVVNHYNALNELTETLTKDTKVSYEYDAEGLRTKKTVNGEMTTYVWDGDQLVMELDDKGNVLKRYIRGTSLIYIDRGDETDRQYYVMNPHGDVVQLLNQSGEVIKTYEYDSFGNEVNPDKDDDNSFRYSGEYYDKETESIYLRARYYQPSVARFLTRDTYTGEDDDPLSLNLYTYCGNDGVNNVDPSGHEEIVVSGGAYRKSKKNGYYYEFIETALRKLNSLHKKAKKRITWCIADVGWTTKDKDTFAEQADNIGDIKIKYFKNKDELIKFINKNRKKKKKKIRSFTVFSHGFPGKLALGYNYDETNSQFDLCVNDIASIHSSSFKNPKSSFYSCNTATTDENGKKFAELWQIWVGGKTIAYDGKTDYQYIRVPHTGIKGKIYKAYEKIKNVERPFPQKARSYPTGKNKKIYTYPKGINGPTRVEPYNDNVRRA